MKVYFFIFLIFSSVISFSQIEIKGAVYQQNGPLEGAAVYLNNTMLGTTTNAKGQFSLPVKEGQYYLVVSYLGYETITYALNTSTYTKPLVFALQEKEDVLDEIVIKKTIYDNVWKHNLIRFKKEFIGTTELAEECEILNPKTLHFEFDSKTNTLTAFNRKPLQIKHKGLGYLITYDLVDFTIQGNYTSYLGYSRYQPLKGNKRKQKRWKKNRLKAYQGSPMHFYRASIANRIYEDGFVVNQFKRVPNPERPSEKKIKRARNILRNNRGKINFTKNLDNPKTALDSALVITRKSRLPKFKDYLVKSKLPQDKIISVKDSVYYLEFEHNLSIVYTKEKEELGFVKRGVFSKPRKPTFQTSSLIPLQKPSAISKIGVLYNPLDVFYEGYWSYEKFGNALPLDYEPNSSRQ